MDGCILSLVCVAVVYVLCGRCVFGMVYVWWICVLCGYVLCLVCVLCV